MRERALPMPGQAPRKSKAWKIASLALVVIGAVAGRVAGHEIYQFVVRPAVEASRAPSNIENAMLTLVTQTKPTLPKRVDDITTLTDISYRDKQMTYVYQLDMGAKQAPPDMAAIRRLVAGRVCASKMKRALDYGFMFDFRYNDPAGKEVGEIELRSADCA